MSAIEITHEPLTYSPHARVSYFRDLALAFNGDTGAEQRLERHADEMREELPKLERRQGPAGVEIRVNPSRTPGQGGFGSPPLWLLNEFATAPRPGRVLAAQIPTFTLPKGASTVNLPRYTTGTLAGVSGDGGAVPSRDLVDAGVSSPVVPIAGNADIALQDLEQSPPGAHIDHAIFLDLAADFDYQVERLLVNGAGSPANQFTGILNLATGVGGVNAITYTDSTPTPAELFPFLGQAAAQIGDSRLMPPEAWLMRTARWAWIASSDVNLLNGPARLLSFPVGMDDAIPATFGGSGPANGTQDAIIACRPSDMLLLESTPTTRVLPEPLSGTLEVRLQLVGYVAALLGRYPTGIGTITGSGMTVQANF